jgi:hypothetical protein
LAVPLKERINRCRDAAHYKGRIIPHRLDPLINQLFTEEEADRAIVRAWAARRDRDGDRNGGRLSTQLELMR